MAGVIRGFSFLLFCVCLWVCVFWGERRRGIRDRIICVLMIRGAPGSRQGGSSAASDMYKRRVLRLVPEALVRAEVLVPLVLM